MKARSFLLLTCVLLLTTISLAAPAAVHGLTRGQDTPQSKAPSEFPLELVLVGVIVLLVVARRVIPVLGGQRSSTPESAPGNYGLAGGAVCPRCGRAFARNLLSPNLVVGKLSRCPHCGKWSIVAAASPEMLAAAEAAQPKDAETATTTLSPAEKLRRQIEDSKFER